MTRIGADQTQDHVFRSARIRAIRVIRVPSLPPAVQHPHGLEPESGRADVEVVVWYGILFAWIFVLGCAVGSFLNVCVYRLPRRKNLLWPSSRCGRCFSPIPLYHNVPLVSYWVLRGH